MPKDTKTLGNNKAWACESLGFVHKKRLCQRFDTTSFVFMKIAVTSFLPSVLLHLAFPYTSQDHSIPLLLPANHHHPSVAR